MNPISHFKQCSTSECHNRAVAKSTLTGQFYCIRCAIQTTVNIGPDAVETLPDAVWPWNDTITCRSCGRLVSLQLLHRNNTCPFCAKEAIKLNVEYLEGVGHD